MKFGVREICDVVLRAKARQKIGNKVFYKGEPVIYFDTLKTSSMEGAATTVYAQGGRGNARLMAWEGERTVTFTMEDALISPEGFMILSGAGLIEAGAKDGSIKQHMTESVDQANVEVTDATHAVVKVSQMPYLPDDAGDNFAYVMFMKDGEIVSEPFIPVHEELSADENGLYSIKIENHPCYDESHFYGNSNGHSEYQVKDLDKIAFDSVLVDYYVERKSGAKQIEITPDKFGGNFYLEASTLFRDTNGVDMPAEFIIPNCKIQSNFTFTMASSGDPSSFTFTMDAFPDYTRFDHSKKVLAAIQIIEEAGGVANDVHRGDTVGAGAGNASALSIHEDTDVRDSGNYVVVSGDSADREKPRG